MFIKKKELNQLLNSNYTLSNLTDELKNKVEKLELSLFDLQYPNGHYYQKREFTCIGYYTDDMFDYNYQDKIYTCKLPYDDLDYTKTDEGFVFVTRERNKAYLLKFGSEECISIPYPCVC